MKLADVMRDMGLERGAFQSWRRRDFASGIVIVRYRQRHRLPRAALSGAVVVAAAAALCRYHYSPGHPLFHTHRHAAGLPLPAQHLQGPTAPYGHGLAAGHYGGGDARLGIVQDGRFVHRA